MRLYKDGMMHQTYENNTELSKEDSAREMEIYKDEFCKEGSRPILVDLYNIKTVSKESRGIYSSKETAIYLSAAALLVGNPVSRIIGKFYLGINKTCMPVKMFTNTEEATDWMKSFLLE
ncbi:MAG: hypothetical protein KAT15_32125 [Bacteroidales bacterium]|nr:hypothetical protein [Bacteroidales bacterium]